MVRQRDCSRLLRSGRARGEVEQQLIAERQAARQGTRAYAVCRPLVRQILEQSQSIANRCEQRGHCAADLLDHFSNEFFLTSRIDHSSTSHMRLHLLGSSQLTAHFATSNNDGWEAITPCRLLTNCRWKWRFNLLIF